jgi:hypothetical protein
LPSALFPPPLILRRRRPLVGCCIPPSSDGHLRSWSRPSLSFLMGAILAPHTREKEGREQAHHTGSLHRTHGEPRHRDSGPWRMLPWRERAKPLGVGWQRLMLVVVCVVCHSNSTLIKPSYVTFRYVAGCLSQCLWSM